MTGLEAILAQIEKDAQSQAEALLSIARQEAQDSLEEAQQEAQRQSKEVLDRAQAQADAIRQRAESAALLEKRDQLLLCKQRLIREAFSHRVRCIRRKLPVVMPPR